MSTNTLATYANGEIIDASHPNEITLALKGEFVGRNSNGIPTPGQSLGTLALPWGNVYAQGLILNGLAVDTSQITSLPNRIVSGATRPFSTLGDFIRANGAALEFTILGQATDLVLSINNTATSVNSDLVQSGITPAPSSNNTCDVNDTTIVNDQYAGEDGTEITIDSVGTEISSRVGQVAAFRTPAGEIFQALIKSPTKLTNAFRGYYFDNTGTPIQRDNLSNNDTLTLLNIGWVFIEDNGTTIDVSYRTPSISHESPDSPQTGDYWFDISNQVWKRYSGVSFDVINRILIGQIVSDNTNTIASRSYDFSNQYREQNNISVEVFSSEIAQSKSRDVRCNVYGTEVVIDISKVSWNITTDLETGLTESPDTDYFLYLSDEGETVISDKKPYDRLDLKGFYHPYESWRCVGVIFNNSSQDISTAFSTPFNMSANSDRVVCFSGWATANKSVGTTQAIDFDGIDIDTHNGVTTGASWKYKIPVGEGGVYSVDLFAFVSTNMGLLIAINGTAYKNVMRANTSSQSSGSTTVTVKPGDELSIVSSTSGTVNGGAITNELTAQISIVKER